MISVKKGFTLMEILFVLLVMMFVFSIKVGDIKQDEENGLAKNVAEQMKLVVNATNSYISLNYKELSSLNNSTPKLNDVSCESSGTCTINIKALKNSQLLPAGFNENTILGKPYFIEVKRKGVSPNYTIDGIVLSSYKGKKGGERDVLFANKIINNIGVDAGLSSDKDVKGLYNSWSALKTDYKSISPNMIGVNVGYNSNQYSVYLRRDGTLPMSGGLSLGNNDIVNAKNINASGNILGNILKANNVNSDSVNSSNIVVAKRFEGNKINRFNGGTEINGKYFNIGVTSSIFTKNVNITGNTKIVKTATFTGPAKFNNSIIAASGTMADLGTVKIGKTLDVKGKSNLENDVQIINNGNTLISSGKIDTDNNVTGALLIASTTSILGGACTDKGALSKDMAGSLLTCKANKWEAVKAKAEFYKTRNRGCDVRNTVTNACSCSAGLTPVRISSETTESCSGGNNETCNTTTRQVFMCN